MVFRKRLTRLATIQLHSSPNLGTRDAFKSGSKEALPNTLEWFFLYFKTSCVFSREGGGECLSSTQQ